MAIGDFFDRITNKFYRMTHPVPPRMAEFMVPSDFRDTIDRTNLTELERHFYDHRGRLIDKWSHYLPLYSRYFEPYRFAGPKILEIGVSMGGSLDLWRRYFGSDASIFGIDIDPECLNRVDPPNQVRIGSQDDPEFLRSVAQEMGGPNIIIDDGSHIGKHQIASFDALFPLLSEGGIYVIEDLHTSYWPTVYRGGLNRKGTAIEMVKGFIDGIHDWYHEQSSSKFLRSSITAIHVHDSLVVIEKGRKDRPMHVRLAGDLKK